jgi:hypothetical protein
MQMPSIEARAVLRNADVPIGASLVLFAQWLGELSSFPWGKHVNDQTGHMTCEHSWIRPPKYVTSYGATELRALFHSNSEQRFWVSIMVH